MDKFVCIPTNQGTGTTETCLCSLCYENLENIGYARNLAVKTNDIDPYGDFVDCTGNDALNCCVCGKNADGIYIFHTDPGHGWLEVTRAECTRLGILDKISHYSYQRGDKVYLEEDCDASLWAEAKKTAGEEFTFDEQHLDETPIRDYQSFGLDI